MKFAALVFAATAAVATAEMCDVTSLSSLAATTEFTQCQTESGYTLTSLTIPDAAMVQLMCSSSACMTLLKDIVSLNIGDCTIGSLAIMSDLVNPVQATCKGSSSGSSSATVTVDSTSSASTSTDASVTTAPSASSTVASTASSSSAASSTVASTASSSSAASSTSSAGSTGSASAGSNSAASLATGVATTALAAIAAAVL